MRIPKVNMRIAPGLGITLIAALALSALTTTTHQSQASAPPGRFVANGDGTTTDTVTGLRWEQPLGAGPLAWGNALTYCNDLVLAGFDDWRLPSINELQTIVDDTQHDPAIDLTAFPDATAEVHWSGTVKNGMPWPWAVWFDDGLSSIDGPDVQHRVRCVRY
jgi:hypothetical protein